MMSKHSTSELFVVTYRHTDGYSYDTGAPDEVFTTREEADAMCAAANEASKKLTFADGKFLFFVETLADRLYTIRDECRNEGRAAA
jgi:hypothetical protein